MSEIKYSENEKEAIETIQNYLLNNLDYPNSYKTLFFRWSLINPLYNACSEERSEVNRILDFGKKYNYLWNKRIKQKTKKLIIEECVGKGRYHELAKNVLSATEYLRNELKIDSNICDICRKKKDICNSNIINNNEFEKLDAVMRIIYQIRCNLFHGDKSELYGSEGERNKRYVKIANEILLEILKRIDSFGTYNYNREENY